MLGCLAIVLVTFLPLQLLPMGRASDFDTVVAESCLSSLGSRLRPAMFVSMMRVAGLDLFASHALAGPLYRLEAIGRRLAEGEIPASIRVRRGDDLDGTAAVLDRVAAGLRDGLRRARDQTGRARATLSGGWQRARWGPPTSASGCRRSPTNSRESRRPFGPSGSRAARPEGRRSPRRDPSDRQPQGGPRISRR